MCDVRVYTYTYTQHLMLMSLTGDTNEEMHRHTPKQTAIGN